VVVFFIGTVYRWMLVFSTHSDFHPPVSGVLPQAKRENLVLSGRSFAVFWRRVVELSE
jgi:hypothetical protein